MDFLSTLSNSMLEGFLPSGWNLKKIDGCCVYSNEQIFERQNFWNDSFKPVECENINDFNMLMGHEIALEISKTRSEGRKLALILPVGPMGMYRWIVYFLKEWGIDCEHVYSFNMDEWSDSDGNTLDPRESASFQYSMEKAFYEPLGNLSVPKKQRNFATKSNLPEYPQKIMQLKQEGAKLVTVYGIGRIFHIAFWEPHFAQEFSCENEWKKQNYRLGAKLHPLTIEQNAITSFKSRTTLVPCRANTIGPGIFLQSDCAIGGCDGALQRGMNWQAMSLWVTLRHGPDMWIPSSFMPTIPGKLFFLKELAQPMVAECN
ncbi:MAG: glucosamine-6-phosphate isomerase [Clostridia bacterium]|nr:glucosamine-6-phosphate isomerase [Clostridia bacterium]